jgi:hypothetical protein
LRWEHPKSTTTVVLKQIPVPSWAPVQALIRSVSFSWWYFVPLVCEGFSHSTTLYLAIKIFQRWRNRNKLCVVHSVVSTRSSYATIFPKPILLFPTRPSSSGYPIRIRKTTETRQQTRSNLLLDLWIPTFVIYCFTSSIVTHTFRSPVERQIQIFRPLPYPRTWKLLQLNPFNYNAFKSIHQKRVIMYSECIERLMILFANSALE